MDPGVLGASPYPIGHGLRMYAKRSVPMRGRFGCAASLRWPTTPGGARGSPATATCGIGYSARAVSARNGFHALPFDVLTAVSTTPMLRTSSPNGSRCNDSWSTWRRL